MNARLHPEVLIGTPDESQQPLPLMAQDVQRYVWNGRHGAMLIEVRDGVVYVNGQRVEPVAETLEHLGRRRGP